MKKLNDENFNRVDIYSASLENSCSLPIFLNGIQAGFPSPADDYIEKQLNLNDLVIKNPTATFFVRVEGDSMKEAQINAGDILAVDRSLTPSDGKIIVALVNGEFTVKRLLIHKQGITLKSENSLYPPIQINAQMEFQVWGVVTYVVHKVR